MPKNNKNNTIEISQIFFEDLFGFLIFYSYLLYIYTIINNGSILLLIMVVFFY